MSEELEHEDVRKIGKVGKYSYCVTIPKDIMRSLGWRSRQLVVVAKQGDQIVIRDYEHE